MAKKTTKLTTFKSSETVVTDEYLNSIYGGLHGTDKESLYNSTDPLVHGHVHDGEHADGHASKIDLSKHTTGSLPSTYIAAPGQDKEIIFNDAGTLDGASTFTYYKATGDVRLSQGNNLYFGTIDTAVYGDSSTGKHIRLSHTLDTIAGRQVLNISRNNNGGISGRHGSMKITLGDVHSSLSPGNTLYNSYLGLPLDPFKYVNTEVVYLTNFLDSSTLTDRMYITSHNTIDSSYGLSFPGGPAASAGYFMKSIYNSSGRVQMTWDLVSSIASPPPGSPYRSFQFNSADTFAGAPTLLFTQSHDVVFSMCHKWYFGSVDDTNHFWMEYELGDFSVPTLEFYAGNTIDSKFVYTNGVASGTTDITLRLKNDYSYFYPKLGHSQSHLGWPADGRETSVVPWTFAHLKNLKLWSSTAVKSTGDSVVLNAVSCKEAYQIELPKYEATTVDMVLRVVDIGARVELTWDTMAGAVTSSGLIGSGTMHSLAIFQKNCSPNIVDSDAGTCSSPDGKGAYFLPSSVTGSSTGGSLIVGRNSAGLNAKLGVYALSSGTADAFYAKGNSEVSGIFKVTSTSDAELLRVNLRNDSISSRNNYLLVTTGDPEDIPELRSVGAGDNNVNMRFSVQPGSPHDGAEDFGSGTTDLAAYMFSASGVMPAQIRLYDSDLESGTANFAGIQAPVKNSLDSSYVLVLPTGIPATTDYVLVADTADNYNNTYYRNLKWKPRSFGGAGSYVAGTNISIQNHNTVETLSSVIFNTVESNRYYVGSTDNYIYSATKNTVDNNIIVSAGNTDILQINPGAMTLQPYSDQIASLGSPSFRWAGLYVDNVKVNSNIVDSQNNTDLILRSNGNADSLINIGYSPTGTSDIIISADGKGFLKTPYKNVMGEGSMGGYENNARTYYLNNEITVSNGSVDIPLFKINAPVNMGVARLDIELCATKKGYSAGSGGYSYTDTITGRYYMAIRRTGSASMVEFSKHASPWLAHDMLKIPSASAFNQVRLSVDAIVGASSAEQYFNIVIKDLDFEAGAATVDVIATARLTSGSIQISRPD